MSMKAHRLQFDVDCGRNKRNCEENQGLFGRLPKPDFTVSDEEDGGMVADMDSGCGTPFKSFGTPRRNNSSQLWDSGLGSPTPGLSVKKVLDLSPKPELSLSCSPIPFALDGGSDEELEPITPLDDNENFPLPMPLTPPHKKFKSLRLYDTPHTPKSLLERASRRIHKANRSRLLSESLSFDNTSVNDSKLLLSADRPQTNINPFTSAEKQGTKRDRSTAMDGCSDESFDADDSLGMPCSKKLALHEINTSRYNEEFHEVCKLGDGEFGSVFKCINRLDGCTYAIKKSKKPVAGSAYERSALNEVYAHAVLGKHEHMVRYYSAWAENDHMFIQNEYCNGGSLQEQIAQNVREEVEFSELELKLLLTQVAQGLRYIHSQHLVHLDIKPGNIFQHRCAAGSAESGVEEDIGEEGEEEDREIVTYKIGDLGHVTSVVQPQVEEGDCRYLPNEILQEEFQHLQKADVFSLALTVLQAGGIGELPKNGPRWHRIRQGQLPYLPHCSIDFNMLLKTMVHPDPAMRPSAHSLVQHPVLCPFAKKSRAQLKRELNEEKLKNEMLSRELQAAREKTPGVSTTIGKSSRIIGRGFTRSSSTMF